MTESGVLLPRTNNAVKYFISCSRVIISVSWKPRNLSATCGPANVCQVGSSQKKPWLPFTQWHRFCTGSSRCSLKSSNRALTVQVQWPAQGHCGCVCGQRGESVLTVYNRSVGLRNVSCNVIFCWPPACYYSPSVSLKHTALFKYGTMYSCNFIIHYLLFTDLLIIFLILCKDKLIRLKGIF